MTLPFDQKHVPPPIPPGLFVLVHPGQNDVGRHLSLGNTTGAGVLMHCRAALGHARAINMAVAFVAAWPKNIRVETYWIRGLEPHGRDMVFRRANSSCYASRYFTEAAESYRTLVIAGFLNASGCIATVIDALRVGQTTTFLRDAIAGATHEPATIAGLRNLANGHLCIRDTTGWMAATSGTDADRTRPLHTILPSTPARRSTSQ